MFTYATALSQAVPAALSQFSRRLMTTRLKGWVERPFAVSNTLEICYLRWNQFKVALGDLGNAIISWYLLLESYILVIGKVTIVLLQNHDQIINKDNNSKLKTCSQVLLAFLFFSFDFSCSFKPFNVVGQCGNCLKLFDLAQRVTQYWWYPQKTLGF